jgi:RHS repeat-associated protein
VSGAENYGYNNANMLVSRNGSGYVNDLDGNTLSGGGRSNVWDSQNRLVSCNYTAPNGVAYSSQFTYGADGLRRRSVVTSNGVTNIVDTVYDASMPVEEVGYAQGTNTPYPSAIYLIGPRGPEYRRDVVHQSVAWYVYDGLGSVVEEVDPSGNITAARKYDVYGMVRSGQSGSSSQKYVGSLGHESEGNTGLIYMRARYMDPVLGRFISEDPSRDGANWFVYCGDEPVNACDPDGKRPQTQEELGEVSMGLICQALALLVTALELYSRACGLGPSTELIAFAFFLEAGAVGLIADGLKGCSVPAWIVAETGLFSTGISGYITSLAKGIGSRGLAHGFFTVVASFAIGLILGEAVVLETYMLTIDGIQP